MTIADFKQSIISVAREKGLDPSFAAGIVSIESGGNPSAGIEKFGQHPDGSWYSKVNYAQGVGLTQVIPVEAPGNWAGRPSVGELLDPLFNLDAGFTILADDLARCGTKEGAACAYFSGHCIPTGASDPNASDYQYIQRAMAAEQRFLDWNGAAQEDGDLRRLNGKSAYFHNRTLERRAYLVNVDIDFPGVPPGARGIRVEPVLAAGAGALVIRDADGSWAGPVLPPSRTAQVDVIIGPINEPPLGGARGFRMEVSGATITLDDLGIVGYF